MCEVNPRTRLSEGSCNNKDDLKIVAWFQMSFGGGRRLVGLFEVRPRMRLSEGFYNKTNPLKFCIWFQRGFVGAGGLGV